MEDVAEDIKKKIKSELKKKINEVAEEIASDIMKDVIETVQKIRDGGDDDTSAQQKPAEEPKKVMISVMKNEPPVQTSKTNRAEWANQQTTYENNIQKSLQLIQDAYAQEWDMTATLATSWIEQIKDGATQLDLVRKVFETSTNDMRKLESTLLDIVIHRCRKGKARTGRGRNLLARFTSGCLQQTGVRLDSLSG